jgi:predicted aspartyl protease
MPVLHLQYRVTDAQTTEAQPVAVPPSVALRHRGPCLQASLTLFQPMAQAMLQEGRAVPEPASGFALLDTGASHTCVDEQTARELHLPVVDTATMASASHASTSANVYPVTIEIAGLPIPIHAPHAIGGELRSQGLLALIGRDVLQSCTLFYNGVSGEITLCV